MAACCAARRTIGLEGIARGGLGARSPFLRLFGDALPSNRTAVFISPLTCFFWLAAVTLPRHPVHRDLWYMHRSPESEFGNIAQKWWPIIKGANIKNQ